MAACHAILATDTEENGMVAQRVLFDMHKTYKQALEEQSGPFFVWLQQVCKCLAQLNPTMPLGDLLTRTSNHDVYVWFLMQLYGNIPQEFSMKLGPHPTSSAQVPANRSFKLASEVALMIVFLFQCHPRRLQEHASTLLPLMVKVWCSRFS